MSEEQVKLKDEINNLETSKETISHFSQSKIKLIIQSR